MSNDYLHSSLADDPVLSEIIEAFVHEMPTRIHALETLAHHAEWEKLARTAHQLKGAAGGYGFHALTPSAARLEQAARCGQQEEKILSALEELVNLCRRVRTGTSIVSDVH